jgi:hypothetical protein
LLPESFGPLFVSVWALLQHLWGIVWDSEGVFSPLFHQLSIPSPLGRPPQPSTTRLCWSEERESLSQWVKEASSSCTKEFGKGSGPNLESCSSDWSEPGLEFRPASGGRMGVWSTPK